MAPILNVRMVTLGLLLLRGYDLFLHFLVGILIMLYLLHLNLFVVFNQLVCLALTFICLSSHEVNNDGLAN